MDRLIFQSLASGSSGNSYYIGTASRGLLIDAGIGARIIRRRLKAIGLDFENLWGILVTHDHADHIRGVGTLAEMFHIPVYATKMVHMGIDRNYGAHPKISMQNRRYVETDNTFTIADFSITPFMVPHDSMDCVGYALEWNGIRFCIATDVGEPTEEIKRQISMADYLVIEANHDKNMLENGKYPVLLKKRIASSWGHLSNDVCASLLAENATDRLKHVFLCHLSKENNTPIVAYNTVREVLLKNNIKVGVDFQLSVLERTTASKLYELI